MAKIIINRKRQISGCALEYDVYFMNTYVGPLKSGEKIEVPAKLGGRSIYFKCRGKKIGEDATFYALVNEEDEVVEINCYFNADGRFVVEYADNKPHIATGVPEPKFYCPKCGSTDLVTINETSTVGKDYDGSSACCGTLLFGPLGLLCGFFGNGKQMKTTTYWLCKGCGNKFKT